MYQIEVLQWITSFFLQCDLLEFSAEFLPYVVSWIFLLPLMHVIFDLGSSFFLRMTPCLLFVLLQDTAETVGTSNFFRAFLMNSLNSISQDQWRNFFSVFLHYRASNFQLSNFAFPSFSSSLTYFSRFLTTNDQILMLLAVSLVVLRLTCICLEIPLFNKVNCVKTVQENVTYPLIHPCSNNHRYAFPAFWMSIPGDVNIFQWDRKWFYSRRAEFASWSNVMTAYEVSRNKSEIISFFLGIWKWVLKM